jgi:chromosome segregation ATPase
MKRTKAQLESQLAVAQATITSQQTRLRKQGEQLTDLQKQSKARVAELRSDNVALTCRVNELEARLQHRGGKLSMLKEMTMELAHGYRKYRR